MASTALEEVEQYKKQLKKTAEALVKDLFPKKIVELHKLVEDERFSLVRLNDIPTDLNIPIPEAIHLNHELKENSRKRPRMEDGVKDEELTGTKVYALPNGPSVTNKNLVELTKIIKPYIYDLMEQCNQIKMWIQFLVPKIEDGNNFGVSIQEETMGEARAVEQEVCSYLDQICRFHSARAKFVSKVAKYPHIDDYRHAVAELDEKQFYALRSTVVELRNQYATLHDLIMKNIDKIKTPRSANALNAMF